MIKPCQSYGIHLCEEDLELVRALANSAGEVILSTFSTFSTFPTCSTFSKLSTLTALSALLLLVLIKIRPFPSLHLLLQRWPSPVSTSSQTSFIHLYESISSGRGKWSECGIFFGALAFRASEQLRKSNRLITVKLQKIEMPHFGLFPRPGEVKPYMTAFLINHMICRFRRMPLSST